MYTSGDFCKLTGVELHNFKAMARRDELPTLSVDTTHEGGWRRFSADDVLKVAVANRLATQIGLLDDGLARRTARDISQRTPGVAEIRAGVSDARDRRFDRAMAKAIAKANDEWPRSYPLSRAEFLETSRKPFDVYLGYVGLPSLDAPSVGGAHVGPDSIAAVTATMMAREFHAKIESAAQPGPMKLVLVNVTAVLREVEARAAAAGIPFSDEESA